MSFEAGASWGEIRVDEKPRSAGFGWIGGWSDRGAGRLRFVIQRHNGHDPRRHKPENLAVTFFGSRAGSRHPPGPVASDFISRTFLAEIKPIRIDGVIDRFGAPRGADDRF